MSNSLPWPSSTPTSGSGDSSSASRASQVQKALEKNWLACIELDYTVIGAHLVTSGHLSPAQHKEIKSNSNYTKGRMDDLMTVLHELNSLEAFQVFKTGVVHSGDPELGQRLERDYLSLGPSVGQPQPLESASAAPAPIKQTQLSISDLPPEVLTNILSYLPPNNLAPARLVSRLWNSIVIDSFSHKFQITFNEDVTKVQDFMRSYSSSSFCQALSNFRFETKQCSYAHQLLYGDFFHQFGLKIKALTLSVRLCEAFVRFIFSEPIQPYLKNVEEFDLLFSLPNGLVCSLSSLNFLHNVKNFTIRASQSVSEYGQIEFLSKLLRHEHKIESLSLSNHFCIGDRLPQDILPNLFKTKTIKTLHLNAFFLMNDEQISAMTASAKENNSGSAALHDVSISGKWGTTMTAVTPKVFHKFLVSHHHSLRRLTLDGVEDEHMEALPQMDNLTYLNLEGVSSNLSFTAQMPNLKELDVNISLSSMKLDSEDAAFAHSNLRSLHVRVASNDSSPETIFNYVDRISTWFPNLSQLVICHPLNLRDAILPEKPFKSLEQKRDPGETVWY